MTDIEDVKPYVSGEIETPFGPARLYVSAGERRWGGEGLEASVSVALTVPYLLREGGAPWDLNVTLYWSEGYSDEPGAWKVQRVQGGKSGSDAADRRLDWSRPWKPVYDRIARELPPLVADWIKMHPAAIPAAKVIRARAKRDDLFGRAEHLRKQADEADAEAREWVERVDHAELELWEWTRSSAPA